MQGSVSSNRKHSASSNDNNSGGGKEFEKASKQVRLRNSTYYELASLGIVPESIDSIVRRAIKIAKPIMRETQAKVYSDLASTGVAA
jgi:hypothetical protein